MGCFAEMEIERTENREFYPADSFPLRCRIEDLAACCGYDPAAEFSALTEIADIYSGWSGREPEDLAEEHPMEALARAVRRFLAEYPEEAAMMAAGSAAEREMPAGLPEKAA